MLSRVDRRLVHGLVVLRPHKVERAVAAERASLDVDLENSRFQRIVPQSIRIL